MTEVSESLGTALPKEIARVRDELLPQYQSLRGMPGVGVEPAIAMMTDTLRRADKAMIEGDTVAMIAIYQELQGFNA